MNEVVILCHAAKFYMFIDTEDIVPWCCISVTPPQPRYYIRIECFRISTPVSFEHIFKPKLVKRIEVVFLRTLIVF
jgi:hypothetical protein